MPDLFTRYRPSGTSWDLKAPGWAEIARAVKANSSIHFVLAASVSLGARFAFNILLSLKLSVRIFAVDGRALGIVGTVGPCERADKSQIPK